MSQCQQSSGGGASRKERWWWWCRKLTFTKSWLGNILSGKFHLSAPSAAWFYEGNGRQDPATSCCAWSGPRAAASLISNIATIHWSWPEGLEVIKDQVILTVSIHGVWYPQELLWYMGVGQWRGQPSRRRKCTLQRGHGNSWQPGHKEPRVNCGAADTTNIFTQRPSAPLVAREQTLHTPHPTASSGLNECNNCDGCALSGASPPCHLPHSGKVGDWPLWRRKTNLYSFCLCLIRKFVLADQKLHEHDILNF